MVVTSMHTYPNDSKEPVRPGNIADVPSYEVLSLSVAFCVGECTCSPRFMSNSSAATVDAGTVGALPKPGCENTGLSAALTEVELELIAVLTAVSFRPSDPCGLAIPLSLASGSSPAPSRSAIGTWCCDSACSGIVAALDGISRLDSFFSGSLRSPGPRRELRRSASS